MMNYYRRFSQPISRQVFTLFIVGLGLGISLTLLLFHPAINWTWYERIHVPHESFEHDLAKHKDTEVLHKHEDTTAQKELFNEVRVLCWIMTGPHNHRSKAIHATKTWGKRCNKLLVMSSEKDSELETVALPVKEGRNFLWKKTKEAFKYIYENHLDEADWFIKADDDTYVVVENLRYFLYPYDTNFPIYFGCRLRRFVKQGFMSGGAGYVLSKEALKRFVEKGLTDSSKCRTQHDGPEDVNMGKCLENLGVKIGDTRDAQGRGRFLPLTPMLHLMPEHSNRDNWYYKYSYYKPKGGLDCCSDYVITFHDVGPNTLYGLEYLIYHLRPYGIVPTFPALPEKMSMEDMESCFANTATRDLNTNELKENDEDGKAKFGI